MKFPVLDEVQFDLSGRVYLGDAEAVNLTIPEYSIDDGYIFIY